MWHGSMNLQKAHPGSPYDQFDSPSTNSQPFSTIYSYIAELFILILAPKNIDPVSHCGWAWPKKSPHAGHCLACGSGSGSGAQHGPINVLGLGSLTCLPRALRRPLGVHDFECICLLSSLVWLSLFQNLLTFFLGIYHQQMTFPWLSYCAGICNISPSARLLSHGYSSIENLQQFLLWCFMPIKQGWMILGVNILAPA